MAIDNSHGPAYFWLAKLRLLLKIHLPGAGVTVHSVRDSNLMLIKCQPLSSTSVCFCHHCAGPAVLCISVDKDVLCEFHWLLELQSKSSHKSRNSGYESLSEGKQIEWKMEKY